MRFHCKRILKPFEKAAMVYAQHGTDVNEKYMQNLTSNVLDNKI